MCREAKIILRLGHPQVQWAVLSTTASPTLEL